MSSKKRTKPAKRAKVHRAWICTCVIRGRFHVDPTTGGSTRYEAIDWLCRPFSSIEDRNARWKELRAAGWSVRRCKIVVEK